MILDWSDNKRRKTGSQRPKCKCGKLIKYKAKECLECYRKRVTKPKPVCKICGKPIRKYTKNKVCIYCFYKVRQGVNKPKSIIKCDLSGKILKKYDSVYHAIRDEKNLTYSQVAIVHNLKGRNKSAYGFLWKYE